MKRILFVLITVILCAQMFSCNSNNLPLTSDNFPKDFVNSFSDNYHIVDPQLAYVTASPWEVEIKDKKTHSYDGLYLALINNVDKAQFVAGIERTDFYMGPPSYSVFVYQTSDAPTPMKDWTIKSVRILEISPLIDSYEAVLLRSGKYMETILSSSTVLHTYNKDSDSDFLDMTKSAYTAPDTPQQRPEPIRGTDDENPNYLRYYSLLIDFNESESIVWHSYLFADNDNLYFECTSYDSDDIERKLFSMARISDEYATEIRGMIEALS